MYSQTLQIVNNHDVIIIYSDFTLFKQVNPFFYDDENSLHLLHINVLSLSLHEKMLRYDRQLSSRL